MPSRKDYLAISSIIRDNTTPSKPILLIEVGSLVSELADYFKKDNPNFDRDKFIKACYKKEGE